MPLDFIKKYLKAYEKNVNLVLDELDSKSMKTKIENFSIRHGFEETQVIEEIKNNKLFRAFFAKNPSRQNFYEKTAAEYIETIRGVKEFKNLGTASKVLMNGGVWDYKEVIEKGARAETRTIDFEWKYKNYECYATHKYIGETGGSQNNAYKDVESFISEANKGGTKRGDNMFFAIVDGGYFNVFNSVDGVTNLQRLEVLANNKNVFTCTINDLSLVLAKVCI